MGDIIVWYCVLAIIVFFNGGSAQSQSDFEFDGPNQCNPLIVEKIMKLYHLYGVPRRLAEKEINAKINVVIYGTYGFFGTPEVENQVCCQWADLSRKDTHAYHNFYFNQSRSYMQYSVVECDGDQYTPGGFHRYNLPTLEGSPVRGKYVCYDSGKQTRPQGLMVVLSTNYTKEAVDFTFEMFEQIGMPRNMFKEYPDRCPCPCVNKTADE